MKQSIEHIDGICYYRHPVIAWANSVPDLTILANGYEPLAVKCMHCDIQELKEISDLQWQIDGRFISSPLLDLDDYLTGLQQKFDRERLLRRKFKAVSAIALPLISRIDFEKKFCVLPRETKVIWRDLDFSNVLIPSSGSLSPRDWKLAKSVFQGINPLNRGVNDAVETAGNMGHAIRILEKEIALLDDEQHKVAIQIAPGPQRIRGLAGTEKTVVLAMKAANIHLRYPRIRSWVSGESAEPIKYSLLRSLR